MLSCTGDTCLILQDRILSDNSEWGFNIMEYSTIIFI